MLSYSEFVEKVRNGLKERLEYNYSIEVKKVLKNNDVECVGLCISEYNKQNCPIIYMERFYKEYQEGSAVEDIAECIAGFIESCNPNIARADVLSDYSQMKDKIFYKLVNCEKNRNMLKKIPYIKYKDLAIIFNLYLGEDEENSISIAMIDNDSMEMWGIDVEELFKQAKKNTPKLFPMFFRSMGEMMKEIAEEHLGDDVDKNIINELFKEELAFPLYVLTNESGINGAAVILYDGALKGVAERLKSNLIVIPSSIHEVLIVPYEEELNINNMKNMVYSVNRSEVKAVDILSDNVYIYSREKDIVYMVE